MMEIQHLQTQRRLTAAELMTLFKAEELALSKEPKNEYLSATERMKRMLDSHLELCMILAEKKMSELNAVKNLTVIEFNKLLEMKRR